jgi:hypothetical protein
MGHHEMGVPGNDPLSNNSLSNVSNNLSQGGWERAVNFMTPEE